MELFIFLCFMVLFGIGYTYEQNKKKENANRAHDRVLDLRARGIDAHLCEQCKGKGVVGIWDRECGDCGGQGYTYTEPPLEKQPSERKN